MHRAVCCWCKMHPFSTCCACTASLAGWPCAAVQLCSCAAVHTNSHFAGIYVLSARPSTNNQNETFRQLSTHLMRIVCDACICSMHKWNRANDGVLLFSTVQRKCICNNHFVEFVVGFWFFKFIKCTMHMHILSVAVCSCVVAIWLRFRLKSLTNYPLLCCWFGQERNLNGRITLEGETGISRSVECCNLMLDIWPYVLSIYSVIDRMRLRGNDTGCDLVHHSDGCTNKSGQLFSHLSCSLNNEVKKNKQIALDKKHRVWTHWNSKHPTAHQHSSHLHIISCGV